MVSLKDNVISIVNNLFESKLLIYSNSFCTHLEFSEFSFDKIIDGGIVAIIGLSVVFLVLALIWMLLLCFNLVFNKLSFGNKKSDEITHDVAPVVTVQPTTTDQEIVAVISAAIAMAESEAPGTKFRVVSFKRV